jgi:hypothetical protein
MAESDDTPTIEEQIEELAALQFTDEEIATVLRMDINKLAADYRVNVDRGRLLAEAEVRRSLLQMAKQGSSPAQKAFMELNARAKESVHDPEEWS